MANEAQIRSSLNIRKGHLIYQSNPTGFNGNVTGTNGPSPGAINVTKYGTDVDLSELTTPGYCHLVNLDSTNYVEWGIYYPALEFFFPIGEILPGESYIIRFSRNLLEAYEGTGTGTTAPTNTFRLRANTASCKVLVAAFEA